jgi:two-component system cell cycle response regulator
MSARILVIEDNPTNLELMTYLLHAFGHVAITESDGRAGCDAIRREKPDLVICDVQLPHKTGYEIAREIKSDAGFQGIPLVAVTALAMVGDQEKVMSAGFDGYISKPIAPETFVEQIDQFLPAELRSKRLTGTPGSPAPAVPQIRGRILSLDDSPMNHEVLRGALAPLGFEVIAANTVAEAMAVAYTHPPDLIISDVQLVNETGLDFIRAVKKDPKLKDIPFMFLSSSALGGRSQAEGLGLGAVRFIMRPIEPQQLIDAVQQSIARRQEY